MFKYTAEIVLGPSFEFKHAQNPTSERLARRTVMTSSTSISRQAPTNLTRRVQLSPDSRHPLCHCKVLIVSIVVPFFGLTNFILRILKGNPKKELQWRLQVCLQDQETSFMRILEPQDWVLKGSDSFQVRDMSVYQSMQVPVPTA